MHGAQAQIRFMGGMRRRLRVAAAACLLLALPALAQSTAPGATPAAAASQALKIYQAIGAQDYKTLFHLVAFTAAGKATLSTDEQFAIDVRAGAESSYKSPEDKARTEAIFHSMSDIMAGEAVITGNTAVVPTSARITVDGQTRRFNGEAHLILDEGVWKFDLTIDEDSEKATSQRTMELIGKPEPASP